MTIFAVVCVYEERSGMRWDVVVMRQGRFWWLCASLWTSFWRIGLWYEIGFDYAKARKFLSGFLRDYVTFVIWFVEFIVVDVTK